MPLSWLGKKWALLNNHTTIANSTPLGHPRTDEVSQRTLFFVVESGGVNLYYASAVSFFFVVRGLRVGLSGSARARK